MDKPKKIISILGSTGSIGRQTLDVIDQLGEEYSIGYLTVNNNIDLLAEQVHKYKPKGVVVQNESSYQEFRRKYNFSDLDVLTKEEGVCQAASFKDNDIVLSALVGFAGLQPTLSAIHAGKTVALANKETLVAGGSLVMTVAKLNNVKIIAVDSEHSAVLQCLIGEEHNSIEKIILTASGGPFHNTPHEKFSSLSIEQALAHPNWSMGSKITIDSATMMNKGFEVIEAKWLFDIDIEKIDVVIHPQSIIHSFVQFVDGSIKAQLGLPDMRLPISYALSYPERRNFNFPRLNLIELANLEFFKPDYTKFPCLRLAYEAIGVGGTASVVLNAANEVAVAAFLNGRIAFHEIPKWVEHALDKINLCPNPSLNQIIEANRETRFFVERNINLSKKSK